MKAVVIGSSAYGSEVARDVLRKLILPDNSCVIYIPHIEADITFKELSLFGKKIEKINEGAIIRPKFIYIGIGMPQSDESFYPSACFGIGYELKIIKNNGKYIFQKGRETHEGYIDAAFSAVADAFGTLSMGVILNGCGNDGVMGVKAIKSKGGITIAQNIFPERYGISENMPQSAIDSGNIDHILKPDEMGAKIEELLS